MIRLFPTLLPQQAREDARPSDKSGVKLDDVDLESGILALIEYLTEVSLMCVFRVAYYIKIINEINTTLFHKYRAYYLACYSHRLMAILISRHKTTGAAPTDEPYQYILQLEIETVMTIF